MIRMLVRHPVEDFGTWKQAYDEVMAGAGVAGDPTIWFTSRA